MENKKFDNEKFKRELGLVPRTVTALQLREIQESKPKSNRTSLSSN